MTPTNNLFLTAILLNLVLMAACGGTPTPPPKPTPNPAAVDALKALRKMKGATEIGISFEQYGSRMIDLKAEIDESSAHLPDGELKNELTAALQAYVDAMTVWNQSPTSDIVISGFEPVRSIQRKYQFQEMQQGYYALKKVALSTIWADAQRHIDRASELLDQ